MSPANLQLCLLTPGRRKAVHPVFRITTGSEVSRTQSQMSRWPSRAVLNSCFIIPHLRPVPGIVSFQRPKKKKIKARARKKRRATPAPEQPRGCKGIPDAGALRSHRYSNSPSIRFVAMEAKSECRSLRENGHDSSPLLRIKEETINGIHMMRASLPTKD